MKPGDKPVPASRQCEGCGRDFAPRDADESFCSDPCLVLWWGLAFPGESLDVLPGSR